MNRLIAEDFAASGLGKMEVARRVWGNPEKYRDLGRILDGKVTPGPSIAVALAHALGQPETRYLAGTPLAAVARELAEANRLAASLHDRLQELEATVAALPTAKDLRDDLQTVTAAIQSVATGDTRAARPVKKAAK